MANGKSEDSSRAERPAWMLTEQEIDEYFAEFGPVRIAVAGSEDWTNRRSIAGAIRRALKFLNRDSGSATLLHSGLPGAARLAESIALELSLGTRVESSSWNPIPGAEAHEQSGDILLAFIRDGDPVARKALKSWLKEDRPAILCQQDGDGAVRGKFFNMDRD